MAFRLSAIALGAAAIVLPLAAHAQTGCLAGSVVNTEGQPVKGSSVGLAKHTWRGDQLPGAQGISDDSGEFRIDGIPPGAYQASAANPALGYSGMWLPSRNVSIAASAICTRITFNVGSPVAKLKLAVTDSTTNKEISNILLDVFAGDKPGLWLPVEPLLSRGVPPQVPSLTKLRIVVTAKGYSSSEVAFSSLAPGETREIVATLSPKVLGCISGVAVDDSYSPVVAAQISARFMGEGYAGDIPAVQTDENGKFTVDNLRTGDYVLWPEKESDGFSHNWSGWRGQVELQRVTVPAGDACPQVTVNMGPRGALLSVRAVDGATHQPLTDIAVNFRNSLNKGQGGAILGKPREPHELLIPSHSNVEIQVRARGYRPSEFVPVGPLAAGEKQDLTISLQRDSAAASIRQ